MVAASCVSATSVSIAGANFTMNGMVAGAAMWRPMN